MGFIGNPENDFELTTSNAVITNNIAIASHACNVQTVVYASTACVYPKRLQVG
jgi:nucleoside-diphosphate-sugar epimerase